MESVTEIAQRMVRDFVEHRWDRLAETYGFPAVVFFGPEIFVLSDKRDFLSTVKAYRSALSAKGMNHIETVVEDVQCEEQERYQFQVRNAYLRKDDTGLTEAIIRYFLDARDGAPKIRMVEYLVTPFNNSMSCGKKFETVH